MAIAHGSVIAVSSGRKGLISHGSRTVETAFVKMPIDGPVKISMLGIEGDEHVYEHHGGPDMALLLYPIEHYSHWRDLGLEVPEAGAMAENLTTEGVNETDVAIGDFISVGSVVLQVAQPRSPCFKLAARFARKSLPIEMQSTGYTGFLVRVIEPGICEAGDALTLEAGTASDRISVAEAGRILNVDRHDVAAARRLLSIAELGETVRNTLTARVAAGGQHGEDVDRLYLE
jgi:MOSC domain-containing protein YiiM